MFHGTVALLHVVHMQAAEAREAQAMAELRVMDDVTAERDQLAAQVGERGPVCICHRSICALKRCMCVLAWAGGKWVAQVGGRDCALACLGAYVHVPILSCA